ncbi:hypothetical protein HPB47_008321 [Ixodes persulcatus]|uniref:Uncharacterized protein n=1 Tax=Ixodes persulcatus TaxID=34615 RepID=A0AC60P502_IXOPE|nr:hypothetical protein HPB47_008321 [Ixodes persulcatus]
MLKLPSQCFNCQALRNISKYCKNAVKCKKCAGRNATKDCKGGDPLRQLQSLGALARSKAFVNGPRQALKPVETVEVNDTAASQKSPVASVAISKPTDSQTTSGTKPQER